VRLIKVYSNKESFRTVKFNESGLSFIVAQQKNPESSTKGQTYNGVGKSLLVRIIHFCLGANADNSFCDKLRGWEFYVDFIIDRNKYTAKRSTDNPKTIFLNEEEMLVKKFNEKLGNLCFNIPDDFPFLSFRSLLPFFVRPKKDSYVNYDEPNKVGTKYQIILYNSFLLGLDVFLVKKKYEIKKEQDRIKDLEKNFKKDTLLRDFFYGNKDVTLTIVELEERIRELDQKLTSFKVAEDYYEVQIEADRVESTLFEISNKVILLQNNIDSIDEGLKIEHTMSKNVIENIYKEASVHFSESLMKTLNELESFYEKLITNRKKKLLEQKNKLIFEQTSKVKDAKKLQTELDRLIKYLGDHQALDLFVTISNQNSELKMQRESLRKYRDLQAEYKEKQRQAEIDQLEQTDITEKYLKDMESDIIKLRDYFRGLAKRFYPTSVTGLTIENNDGVNQQRFLIEAKIESDQSDGINNVKIFCYDMTVLFKGYNHNINFIFHDSRLFDGIDERQKAELFKTVFDEFKNLDKQYIATVNQNQLEEIKRQLKEDNYIEIITENIVLTLTDEDPSEKLLGITVDIS
jgi:uncharacterized protein YydD (DUF2326 family)